MATKHIHSGSLHTLPDIIAYYRLLPTHAAVLLSRLDGKAATVDNAGVVWYRWSDVLVAMDSVLSIEAYLDHLRRIT